MSNLGKKNGLDSDESMIGKLLMSFRFESERKAENALISLAIEILRKLEILLLLFLTGKEFQWSDVS